MIKLKDLLEVSPTGNIKGMKGATGFIKPEEWEAKKKSLKKSIEKTTGYLLTEIKIKVLSGHLTAKDKKVVKQMLDKKPHQRLAQVLFLDYKTLMQIL